MKLRVKVIDKVRKFVNKIHHLTVFSNALRNYCKVINKNYHKPDFNIITQQNSIFLILEKFIQMRKELDFFIYSNKHLDIAYLDDNNWN